MNWAIFHVLFNRNFIKSAVFVVKKSFFYLAMLPRVESSFETPDLDNNVSISIIQSKQNGN